MARKRSSRATLHLIARWRHHAAMTRKNLQDFPDLKEELEAFERGIDALERENQEQERLKADLKAKTQEVNGLIRELTRKSAAIKRRWEAKYGPRSPKIRELAPATEGALRPPQAGA